MATGVVRGTYKWKYYNDKLTNCDNRANNENLLLRQVKNLNSILFITLHNSRTL